MGKLRQMAPRLANKVAPRLAPMVDHGDERSRDAAAPWRKWEKTAEWQRLRWSVLVRDDFVCQRCGAEHELTLSTRAMKAIGREDLVKGKSPDRVADHIHPHKGDRVRFMNPLNLQCLCKACHDRHKQRADRSAAGRGG